MVHSAGYDRHSAKIIHIKLDEKPNPDILWGQMTLFPTNCLRYKYHEPCSYLQRKNTGMRANVVSGWTGLPVISKSTEACNTHTCHPSVFYWTVLFAKRVTELVVSMKQSATQGLMSTSYRYRRRIFVMCARIRHTFKLL